MQVCEVCKEGEANEFWDWPCGSSDLICKACKDYRIKYHARKAKQALALRDFKKVHHKVFKELRRLERVLADTSGFK